LSRTAVIFVTSKGTLQKLPHPIVRQNWWAHEGILCGIAPYGEGCIPQSR